MRDNFYIENSGTLLKLKDATSNITLASVSYDIKDSPKKHLYIHCIASREKQKGYYSRLFKQIEEIAIRNTCESLRMKTGSTEEYRGVRRIHQKYGFEILPQTNLDKQRQRIGLEKQLFS